MLIISIFFLLLSNAVTLRRDKSILYNRVAILILLYSSFNGFICLFLALENKGIPLYGGLFHATGLTQIFQISIFFACIMIIVLTALYPKRVLLVKHSFIEYPLVLLFIICSVVFLVSTSNIFIIYLSIILIVYALYILNSVYTYPKLNLLNFNSYFLLTGLIILWYIFRILPLGLQLLILFRLFLYIYSGFSDVFQLNASSGPDDY
jgi:NADH-ubiquinone oxidoreductase chain 2